MFTVLYCKATNNDDTGIIVSRSMCVDGRHISHIYRTKSLDQPGKVANPVRGQLNRENEYFPAPVRALEFGFASWVRPSRPASNSLLILHTQAESGAYSWGSSLFSRRRLFIY